MPPPLTFTLALFLLFQKTIKGWFKQQCKTYEHVVEMNVMGAAVGLDPPFAPSQTFKLTFDVVAVDCPDDVSSSIDIFCL